MKNKFKQMNLVWSALLGLFMLHAYAQNTVTVGQAYGGGVVAYVFQAGDPGYVTGQTKALIAATTDQANSRWEGGAGWSVTNGTETVLGSGSTNTTKIIATQKTTPYDFAAKLCKNFAGGGFTDWYLPSKDELNKLYLNKAVIGGFVNENYWSSSETTTSNCWYQDFANGVPNNNMKSWNFKCRPVRLVQISATTPVTPPTTLAVGQPYGGGVIAYIFQAGDPGYVAGQTKALIAATTDQANSRWEGGAGWSVTNATETALGSGSATTAKIIKVQMKTPNTFAAKLCKDFTGGGFSDWYLPSKDELNKLYLNKAVIGGFVNENYWSSSETTASNCWYQDFANGVPNNNMKSWNFKCRPVRLVQITATTPVTPPTTLAVGQPYGGGVIAYIFQAGDPGFIAGQTHGLIASTADQANSRWEGGAGWSVTNGTETVLGSGSTNTTKIIATQKTTPYDFAAKLCKNFAGGGFTDWYLPSKDELNKLYLNKAVIGGFVNENYWSSSETTASNCWYQDFANGVPNNNMKSWNFKCRPVRKF